MKETNKNSFTKKNNKLMFKVTSAVLATSLLARKYGVYAVCPNN